MVEPKVANPLVHIMDVDMAITKIKIIEKQVFKDKKLIKKKSVAEWEEEQILQ
jgi:hypothetical protein